MMYITFVARYHVYTVVSCVACSDHAFMYEVGEFLDPGKHPNLEGVHPSARALASRLVNDIGM